MDANFTDFLKEQTLKARSGQQEMIDEKHIKIIGLLWKILSINESGCHVESRFYGNFNIRIMIMKNHKQLAKKFCEILEIRYINPIAHMTGYTWYTENIVFKFMGIEGFKKEWYWNPDFVERKTNATS